MSPLKSLFAGFVVLAIIVLTAVLVDRRSAEPPEASTLPSPTTSVSPAETASTSFMNDKHEITITTSLGDVTFRTYDADAPKAVENIITLARKGFYDGVIFHRVIKGFMIQGGDPTGTGGGGPGYTFADELDPDTESAKRGYVKGTVAMANAGPDTNGSQFFIMHEDYPLPHNYTIFGHVVAGQDVVDAIATVATDGDDRPVQPVTITKVTVTDLP